MKIKIRLINSMLVSLLLLSVILPVTVAKMFVAISFGLILLKIIFSKDIFKYANYKLIIFILFLPVILSSIMYDAKETLRYITILTIALGLPYSNFKINYSLIYKVSALCLFYLIITQILLIFENETIINFRDYAYLTEWSYIFLSYGKIDNLSLDIFFDTNFRAAGLYYNPNILAGLIFLYFILFDSVYKNLPIKTNSKQKNKPFINLYKVVLFFAILGLILTKSRTVILAFLTYNYFVNFHLKEFINLKIKKNFIYFIFLFMIILFLEGNRIVEGVLDEGESFNSKYKGFIDYIKNKASFLNLFLGGTFDKQFDTEYGKLLGAAGIIGVIGYFCLYSLLIKINPSTKSVIFSFLIMSFGTTVLLSLMKIAIILPIIIILLSKNNEKLNYDT